MSAPRYGCPRCGGDDVREANVAHAYLRVLEWNEDGTPAAFEEAGDAEWHSDDGGVEPSLKCFGCDLQFDWDDLVRLNGAS
jgi:hypothetical protein